MSDDLTLRLHNLLVMLEEVGYHTKANTVQLAKSRIQELEAKLAKAQATLKRLHYWLDTDAEILDALPPDERAAHVAMRDLAQAAISDAQEAEAYVDELEDDLGWLLGSAETVIEAWDWWHQDERCRKEPVEAAIEELRADIAAIRPPMPEKPIDA